MQSKLAFYKVFFKPNLILVKRLIWAIMIFSSFSSFSQDSLTYEDARSRLVKTLKKRFIDKAFTQSIDQFYFTTCDSLIKENVVIEDKPIRDILLKLFVACESKINAKAITSLRIPAVNNYFLLTIQAYQKQPINKLYREIGITQTAILQSAFDGLLLGDSIKTFVGLRQMLNFPYYIPARIGLPCYSKYKDTLLYYLANLAPDVLVDRLIYGDSLLTAMVEKSNNRTVKAVSKMKSDNYFDAILPFSFSIFENQISVRRSGSFSYAHRIIIMLLWMRR